MHHEHPLNIAICNRDPDPDAGTPAALAFTQSDLSFDPSAVYGKKTS